MKRISSKILEIEAKFGKPLELLLKEDYEKYKLITKLVEKYDASQPTVVRWMKEYGIETRKANKKDIGKLIDSYIGLRHNIGTDNYFKNKSRTVKEEKLNSGTVAGWLYGHGPFPLKYLKGFLEELKIPIEEVITLNKGKNPFRPDLEEMKKTKCPLGKLIEFHIDSKYGIDKHNYLKNKSRTVKEEKLEIYSIKNWLYGYSSFPLKYLKGFVEELQIPLEEVIEVKGRNPFKPDLEEMKKAGNPLSKLVEFYIDLRHGIDTTSYLNKESETVKKEKLNVGSIWNWLLGKNPFPLKILKGFVDELGIPYDEINYLIEGDIQKGIAKAGNVNTEISLSKPSGFFSRMIKEEWFKYCIDKEYDKIGRTELAKKDRQCYNMGFEKGWLDELIPLDTKPNLTNFLINYYARK